MTTAEVARAIHSGLDPATHKPLADVLYHLIADYERSEAENTKLRKVCQDKENHLDGYRKAADEDRADVTRLAADLATARETNRRLNARCQAAESAARQNAEDCRRAGVSLGRVLSGWSATRAEAEAERLTAEVARLTAELAAAHADNRRLGRRCRTFQAAANGKAGAGAEVKELAVDDDATTTTNSGGE